MSKNVGKPQPLSAEILIAQGSCCGNRCQNCPYEPKWEKGSVELNLNLLQKLQLFLEKLV